MTLSQSGLDMWGYKVPKNVWYYTCENLMDKLVVYKRQTNKQNRLLEWICLSSVPRVISPNWVFRTHRHWRSCRAPRLRHGTRYAAWTLLCVRPGVTKIQRESPMSNNKLYDAAWVNMHGSGRNSRWVPPGKLCQMPWMIRVLGENYTMGSSGKFSTWVDLANTPVNMV